MKKLVLVVICLVLALAIVACSAPAAPAAESPAAASQDAGGQAADNAAQAPEGDGVAAGGAKDLSELTVAVSLGWLENEAGMRQKQGYEESFQEVGIKKYSFVDANYDPVVQSEQIESIIQAKPDILFITPSDPKGISEATQHAIDAGIPVFCSDGSVDGVTGITSEVIIDNYSGGYSTMEYIAEQLDYKGNIGLIVLDANDSWNQRGVAAKDVLAKYPDMKVVAEWSWDSTGVVTPRMAVDKFLAANPNKGDIDAIWCAWDGGCFEGIQACQAAGRTEIIFAGFDGGEKACEMLMNDPQFVVCNAPCIYDQARKVVLNAVAYLNGESFEQSSFATNVTLTGEVLNKVKLEGDEKIYDYDKPGMYEKWGIPVAPTITKS